LPGKDAKVAPRGDVPQQKFNFPGHQRHFLFANPVDARHIRPYLTDRNVKGGPMAKLLVIVGRKRMGR
jgi:hypothetical protein